MMANLQGHYEELAPPLDSLLFNGVPSLSAIDTYIADLDVQLEENSKSLDHCLQSVMKVTNEIVGKAYITPRDALLSMLSTHALEKDSCYDPEPDAVTDILSHTTQMLEQYPGCEEEILQDLLSLSSEQGLSLPLKQKVEDPASSTMSVNAVSNSSEVQLAHQWDKVALHLRRFFYDKLAHLPVSASKPLVDVNEGRRLRYLQSLITIQPMEEVWERYQNLRSQQLEQSFNKLLPDSDTDNMDFLKVAEKCQQLADIIIQMMEEDFVVLNSGVLKKSVNIIRAFHNIYLEKYSDEMSALVEEIWDEMREGVQLRAPSQSFSGGSRESKGKGGSQSSKSLLRTQAHSLESVVSQYDNTAASVTMTTISAKYVKAMLKIVMTILEIEDYVERLQQASAWEMDGLANRRSKRKGSLRGVLKPSSSPEPIRRPLSAMLSSVDSDSFMMHDNLTSSYASDSSMATDVSQGPKVKVVEKMRGEEKIRWSWRLMFKKIAPELGRHMEQHISVSVQECLNVEQRSWDTNHRLERVSVPSNLWGGRLDYPKQITKGVSEIMAELDLFLPFAKAGHEGTLSTVRTAFVDSANFCLKNVHAHLLKLSADVPVVSAIKNLYVILSSAAYVRNYILHYETVLTADDSKKLFSLSYKQFVELVEHLTNLVVQLHSDYICTSILHDRESNSWAEMKEFYEGERCSFPVQMWNYYLRGVQFDMWSVCPPKLAQSTFSDLLKSSLQILTQRYVQAKPSFRRTTQFRCDILTILLSVSEMLFSSSNTLSRCIDVGHTQVPHHAIHNLCSTLLGAMAVVVSPLDILYRINKKGYQYRKHRRSQQLSVSDTLCQASNNQWLSWVRPYLVPTYCKSVEDMRTTTALNIHTKLLLCQPEINWPMTLQAYLMKDYTLSIMFLTQALSLTVPQPNTDTTAQTDIPAGSQGGQIDNVRQLTLSLMNVLINCTQFPDSLVKLLLPVINRCLDWGCLDNKHLPGRDMSVPLWMDCLFTFMQPFVLRILMPVVQYVTSQTSEERQIQPLASVMEELPCGCRSHAAITPRSRKCDNNRGLVDTVLKLVVNQLSDDVFVLPTHLCVLFRSLQDNCTERGMKTPHHCVGLKMIALSLRQCLLDVDQLETLTGLKLSTSDKDNFTLLADCIYHILVSGKVKGSTTPRLAGRFCRDNKDWINDKLQIIVNYLNSEIFEPTDNLVLEGATTEFSDQLYLSVVGDVLKTPSGRSDLERLYWMIYNNQQWQQKHLDMNSDLPRDTLVDSVTFVVDMTPKPVPDFVPTKEFQLIGPCKLDHAIIQNFPLNWEKLLQSDLGLSDFGFRSLLYNRCEMQDGAFLQENEKKPVATLRTVFENEPRELG